MSRRIELVGHTFGELFVESYAGRNKRGKALWKCRCSCGNPTTVVSGDLRSGNTSSCGCLHMESITTHGKAKHGKHHNYVTPEYTAWGSMRQRCTNPNNPKYANYGARGVTVSRKWQRFEPFLAYLMSTIGLRPKDKDSKGRALYSLDRWPNMNGNYEPGNVRWATRKQQRENRNFAGYQTTTSIAA